MRSFPVAITGAGMVCRRTGGAASRFVVADGEAARPGENRVLGLALRCAGLALADHGYDSECGVCVSVSKGWIEELERGVHAGSLAVLDCGADFAARKIAREFHLGGPSGAAVAACASGLASVKLGADWMRDGACKSALVGAAESSNSEMVLRSFERLGVISAGGQTRPFDARRDGFVVGEGAAVFRIERMGDAKPERVLGRVLSVALGADANHLTTPEASGHSLADVIVRAIELAGVEIGWVHVHGTATDYNDRVEASALRAVFRSKVPPVTATKGMTGHLLGASGAVALGLTLSHLREGTIPFVAGLSEVAEEFLDLDLVVGADRSTRARAALVLNHGFGGHIAAGVVAV